MADDDDYYEPVEARIIGIDHPDGASEASLLVEIEGKKLAMKLDFASLMRGFEYSSYAMSRVGTIQTGGAIPQVRVSYAQAARFEGADVVSLQVHFGTIGLLACSLPDNLAAKLGSQLSEHAQPSEKPNKPN